MPTVPVYEFVQFGVVIGCGTEVERDYWAAEGVMPDVSLGKIIGRELASKDEKRKAAWA